MSRTFKDILKVQVETSVSRLLSQSPHASVTFSMPASSQTTYNNMNVLKQQLCCLVHFADVPDLKASIAELLLSSTSVLILAQPFRTGRYPTNQCFIFISLFDQSSHRTRYIELWDHRIS